MSGVALAVRVCALLAACWLGGMPWWSLLLLVSLWRRQSPKVEGSPARLMDAPLCLLLAGLAWAYVVGTWQLAPPPSLLETPSTWTDQLLRGGLRQELSCVLLFWGLREGESGSTLLAWLGCAGWLGWAQNGEGFWLAGDPLQTQLQLLVTATMAICLTTSTGTWSGVLPLAMITQLGLISSQWGLALAIALLLAPQLGPRAWEKFVAFLLAIYFCRLGIPQPTLQLWPTLCTLALTAIAWRTADPLLRLRFRSARWLLALQWGMWTAGLDLGYPAWAALGVMAAIWLRQGWMAQRGEPRAAGPGLYRLPHRHLSALGVVLLSAYLLKPGEEWFNRRLLLGAQKAHLTGAETLWPQPLRWWVAKLGVRLEMGSDDVEIADWLQTQPMTLKPVLLTPGALVQSPLVQRLIGEMSAGRTFAGWNDSELSPGARHMLATHRFRGTGVECLILRGAHNKPEGIKPVLSAHNGSAIYSLPLSESAQVGVVPKLSWDDELAPGSLVPVELEDKTGATAAQLGDTAPPWLVWTGAGPNFLPVPQRAGRYTLTVNGEFQKEILVSERSVQEQLEVVLHLPPTLPSRSLTSVEADISNRSDAPVDLGIYRGLRLQTERDSGVIQPLSLHLAPHAHTTLSVVFDTPELEGEGTVNIELLAKDGKVFHLGSCPYRTWRRLPAVGF